MSPIELKAVDGLDGVYVREVDGIGFAEIASVSLRITKLPEDERKDPRLALEFMATAALHGCCDEAGAPALATLDEAKRLPQRCLQTIAEAALKLNGLMAVDDAIEGAEGN